MSDGSNNPVNLVRLNAKEHYICHHLLTKIYSSGHRHAKMVYAYQCMVCRSNKVQKRFVYAKDYKWLKEELAKVNFINKYNKENTKIFMDNDGNIYVGVHATAKKLGISISTIKRRLRKGVYKVL